MIVGYKRVSTLDQNFDRQNLEGCEKIFEEKASGKNIDRPQLAAVIDFIREGDLVKVWSIDRLGRSLNDLNTIVEAIVAKGAEIEFMSERLVFSRTSNDPFKMLQFQLLGAFSQFERAITERRRLEGIAAAKASGKYKGGGLKRVPFDVEKAKQMRANGASISDIANAVGGSRTTIFRELGKS